MASAARILSDDYGRYFVRSWDPFLNFGTQADATQYISKVYALCTDAEKARIRLAFLGDLTQGGPDEGPKQYDPEKKDPDPESEDDPGVPGIDDDRYAAFGGGTNSADDEYLVYSLLELTDSIHDCSVKRSSRKLKDVASPDDEEPPAEGPTVEQRREYIRRCAGPSVLPVIVDKVRLTKAQFSRITPDIAAKLKARRIQMTLEDVVSWDTFLRYMTSNPTLNFGGKDVGNNMFGRDFMTGMFTYSGGGDFQLQFRKYIMQCIESHVYDDNSEYIVGKGKRYLSVGGTVYADILRSLMTTGIGSKEQNDKIDRALKDSIQNMDDDRAVVKGYCTNVELWAGKDAFKVATATGVGQVAQDVAKAKEVVKLTQLADLCRCMRKVYGPDAKFLLDTDPLIVQVVFSAQLSYEAFKDLCAIDERDARSLLPKQVPTVRLEEDEKRAIEDAYKRYQDSVACGWTLWYCDACNLDMHPTRLDGNINFSPEETGEIFHERSKVKVRLHDVTTDRFHITVRREVDGGPPDEQTTAVTKYGRRWFVGPDALDFSVNTTVTNIDNCIESGDTECRCARDMALKRAADWGMIRHCKNNGMVFVTQDRFCALYAAYMDVETCFVRVLDHGGVLQYSFALMTRATRATQAQVAGGSSPNTLIVALTAITVGMAVFGSVL